MRLEPGYARSTPRLAWTFVGPVAVLLASSRAPAQELLRAPINGASVADIAFDPNTPGLVYAAVLGPGVYRSTDSGATWSLAILPGARSHHLRLVVPSRADPGLLFACEHYDSINPRTGEAIWRSTDRGASWSAVLSVRDGGGCTALTESTTAGTYYAASFGPGSGAQSATVNLHTSTDSGMTWTTTPLAFTSPPSGSSPAVAALVALEDGRLVGGFANHSGYVLEDASGFVAFSDDGGATFTEGSATTSGGVFYTDPILGVAAADSGVLFAIGGDYLRHTRSRSSDGAAWEALGEFSEGGTYGSIRYDGQADSFLFVLGDGVYQTLDAASDYALAPERGGLTGGISALVLGEHRIAVRDPADETHVLLGEWGAGEGVVATVPGTTEWQAANAGLDAPLLDFAVFDETTGYQWTGSLGGTVYFASDGFRSFRQVFRGRGVEEEQVTAFAMDARDPKRSIVALTKRLSTPAVPELRQLDDATQAPSDDSPFFHTAWSVQPLPSPLPANGFVSALLLDGERRFVGVVDTGSNPVGQYLFRSLDGGATYEPCSLRAEQGVRMLARDPSDETAIYAGVGADFAASAPAEPETRGLFRSTDGGDTWTHLGAGSTFGNTTTRALAVDPNDGERLWIVASALNTQLYESLDGGATFADITTGNSVLAGSGYAVDVSYLPELDRVLLAKTERLFVRAPGGGSAWEPAFDLPAAPRSLLRGVPGVATDSGYFAPDELGGRGGEGGSSAGSGCMNAGASGTVSGGAGTGAASSGGRTGTGASSAGGADTGGAGGGADSGSSTEESSGCGCRVASERGPGAAAFALTLVALFSLFRRRSRVGRARVQSAPFAGQRSVSGQRGVS